MPAPTFDIAAAIRRLALIFWHQFGSIVLLGLALLTAPSMMAHALFGVSPPGDTGTWVQTILALLGMIFLGAVNGGVLLTGGRGDDPRRFMRSGIAAARPGVVVALLIAATIMLAVIARLAARLYGLNTGVLSPVVFGLLGWFLVAGFVAVPAAIAERRLPARALGRSFALTRGHRLRILAFAGIVMLALLPAVMLVNLIVFGANATPETAEAALKTMTLASPGLWIGELFWLLVCAFLAPAPAVVFLQLTGRE